MREMKDSGIEWIGEIPKDWKIARLCYLIDGYKAGPFGSALIMDKLSDEGNILIYTPETIATGNTELPTNKYLPECRKDEMQQFFVKSGDIIFPIVGSLGRAMVVNENMPIGIINQRLAKFRLSSNEIVSPFFMRLFGESDFFQTYIELTCRGSIIVNLTKMILHDMPVPIPPIKEQQQIANFLDTKCSEIDATAEDIQKEISLLEDYKKSVITEAVTKGLNPDAEMKDSGIEWIGEIPKDWKVVRLEFLSWVRARLGWKGLKADEYVDEGYPFLSAFNIQDSKIKWEPLNFITKERFDESPEIMLACGDVLLLKDGAGVGKCARIDNLPKGDSTVNSSLAVITCFDNLNYRYLYYSFNSSFFSNLINLKLNGMGVPHLTQEELRKFIVLLPCVKEQQQIADYLDTKCSEIDTLIADKKRQLDILADYKKSLIYEYVTGKKEVPVKDF